MHGDAFANQYVLLLVEFSCFFYFLQDTSEILMVDTEGWEERAYVLPCAPLRAW